MAIFSRYSLTSLTVSVSSFSSSPSSSGSLVFSFSLLPSSPEDVDSPDQPGLSDVAGEADIGSPPSAIVSSLDFTTFTLYSLRLAPISETLETIGLFVLTTAIFLAGSDVSKPSVSFCANLAFEILATNFSISFLLMTLS